MQTDKSLDPLKRHLSHALVVDIRAGKLRANAALKALDAKTGKVRVMIREESRAEISAFAPQQEPSAEGVVIVCEGADDLRVRLALEQAAQALLGVPCSRIQVVKMEEGSR